MGFNARLVITGVCGIVPRRNPPRHPGAICVVLPNAWNNSPKPKLSSDNVSGLRRHRTFIKFDARYLKGSSVKSELTTIFDVYGHRIVVQPFFDRTTASGVTLGDINGLATHKDVAGRGSAKLCLASAAILQPVKNLVNGLVVVAHGELSAPASNIQFVLDNYLSKANPKPKSLASEPTIELPYLRCLILSVRDLVTDQEVDRFIFEKAPQGGVLEIRIATLCEVNPLQWPDKLPATELSDDEDFRWHYEIMDRPQDIKAKLGGLAFPIPRVIPDPGAGNGLNCIPKLFPAVNFSVPK